MKELIIKAIFLLCNVLMIVFSISCIFPILWLINSSFKSGQEFSQSILALPQNINFDNYKAVLASGKMVTYFTNSLIISSLSVLFVVLLAFVTSYCIARIEFRGKGLVYGLYLSGMLVPLHGLLVPLFILFQKTGLYDKRLTLLLPYIAIGLPTAIFLMSSFIKSLPKELEEAALIDGCNVHQVLFSIIFPLCKPVVSTVVILSFLTLWNEFPFALILISNDQFKTISVGLSNFTGMYSVNYPQLMTSLVLASMPVIIVYLLFYKKIIQGMVAGAVKG
ncbi:carbohydrate ABC transporter permease [Lachnospiraceae bacterium ZAX-1]